MAGAALQSCGAPHLVNRRSSLARAFHSDLSSYCGRPSWERAAAPHRPSSRPLSSVAAGYYLQHHSRELALPAPHRRNIPLAAVSDIGGRGRFCESKAMLFMDCPLLAV